MGAAVLGTRYAISEVAAAKERAAVAERGRIASEAQIAKLREDAAHQVKVVEAINAERDKTSAQLAQSKRRLADAARRITALDGEFRRLHDAAAAGVPEAAASGVAGGRDEGAAAPPPAPVPPADVAGIIVENYGRAEANRQQVLRLQGFIKQECR